MATTSAANENPMAQVVIHPGVKRQRHLIVRILTAGYPHITYQNGHWRTVHHATPTMAARRKSPAGGFRPGPDRGPGGPGGGKAA